VEERIISLNRAVLRQLNPEFGQPQASGSSNGDDFGGDDDDEVCAIKALKAQLLTIRSKTSEASELHTHAHTRIGPVLWSVFRCANVGRPCCLGPVS
jgi:hypothetical protein